MEFLNYYFGQHKTEKIIYILGDGVLDLSLKNTIKTTKFDDVLLVFENEQDSEKLDKKILDQVHIIQRADLSKYLDHIIVLDHCKNIDDLDLKNRHVVGAFSKNTDTYKIWNNLREKCQFLVLSTECNDQKNEILEWEKDDKNDVELSVIFPVYNVEKYLSKCLESITQWNAPYVEYIFVNDGSSDKSKEIIEEWSKKDSRIKLYNKVNGGCASARQYGLDRANGKYIGFIDPDDFIDPTMFEKLHSRAMRGSYEIAYCGYNEFYEDTQTFAPIQDIFDKQYLEGTSDVKFISRLISNLRVAIWRGIYHKDLFTKNNIKFHEELRRFDDLPFKVEVFSSASSVVAINENLYFYRLGRAGQDVSANDERLYVHFDIFKILDAFFAKKGSTTQLKRYYQVKVQTHFWALSIIKEELKEEYKEKAAKDLGIENNKAVWKKILGKYYRNREIRKVF